ncbi:hypothetical protein OBBRIDRAFT_793834 [Obba rivulosa]|uniref:Secreted protein n=1 Tax=Obba rivulosa TaxID=1052685 RepID=A0A8E2ASL9_9APHY|nr:hypothetical protein OBBRIDRAFT_793834 [Obba rivulosa]
MSRTLRLLTVFLLSATLVCSTPAPVPVPEPIDAQTAHNIAINENLACSGPDGCSGVLAASNSAVLTSPGALGAAVAVVVGVLGGLA